MGQEEVLNLLANKKTTNPKNHYYSNAEIAKELNASPSNTHTVLRTLLKYGLVKQCSGTRLNQTLYGISEEAYDKIIGEVQTK